MHRGVQIVRKGSLSRKEMVRQVVSGWQATERRLAGVLPLGNMSSGAPYVVERHPCVARCLLPDLFVITTATRLMLGSILRCVCVCVCVRVCVCVCVCVW